MRSYLLAAALAASALLGGCMSEGAKPEAAAPAAQPGSIPIAAAPTAPVEVAPVPLPPASQAGPGSAGPTPLEIAECKAKGGTIQPVGLAAIQRCVIPYKDAGKACTDGDQCEGDCWTGSSAPGPATGQCQPTNSQIGCHAKVEDGKLEGAYMCVD